VRPHTNERRHQPCTMGSDDDDESMAQRLADALFEDDEPGWTTR
jgi:hypothetical protein